MKFGLFPKQQFHQKYTPPPNLYTPVLTQAIQTHSISKQKRFRQTIPNLPGPADYSPNNKQFNKTAKPKALSPHKKAYEIKQIVSPSIPYAPFKPDQEDQQALRELLQNEDLNRSALSCKKKSLGYSFSKAQRTIVNNKIQENKKSLQEIIQNNYIELPINRQSNKFSLEKIRKATQQRKDIIDAIHPQFVPSLELIQLMTKRRTKYTPGPGTYKVQSQQKQPATLFSTVPRFSMKIDSDIGPGAYAQETQKKHAKTLTFSKSQRKLFDKTDQVDLYHRFYIDPLQDNQSKIIGQQKKCPFGSLSTRFSTLQKEKQAHPQQSNKKKKKNALNNVIQKRLKELDKKQRRNTVKDEGLRAISTMASTIQ